MSDPWALVYEGFDPHAVGLREALCTLGNGVFCTRGAAEESRADGVNYPGTYAAGGYNQLESEVAGRRVVNEDLVNFPNWLGLTFRAEGDEWFEPGSTGLLHYRLELRMREGVLVRQLRLRDPHGRETTIESRRLVHMRYPNVAAIEYSIRPENWSGRIGIRSSLDGSVQNTGVARYRQLASRHLERLERGPVAPEGIYLLVQTNQSRFQVAEAARTRVFDGETPLEAESRVVEDGEAVHQILEVDAAEGRTVRVEKVVALQTSRDRGILEAGLAARLAIGRAGGFAELLASHVGAWSELWHDCDVVPTVAPDADDARGVPRVLRLHIFHLLQTVSHNTVGRDVGVPARGLHGEAYRGHIFWDELFIFPFLNLHRPEITRSLLLYRYHRLDMARTRAREAGYAGAMYPWQSSSDGREVTQEVHLNPRSGRWDPDWSRLQRHINAAIAYNVWQYHRATGDGDFLERYGAEMLLEIARFWASAARRDSGSGRYEIRGVMGPDEYHEKLPDAEEGGLPNNAYTNVMAVWCVDRALDVLRLLRPAAREALSARLGLRESELDRWEDVRRHMRIPFHDDGIISQFEGYETLEELDWEELRHRHGDIHRVDRILKAEGDAPDRYKASKQADATMLFQLLSPRVLREIFERLGYPFGEDTIERNVRYYMPRTSHGSTLSQVVFASVLDRIDRAHGWELFCEALRSDVEDVQGGTTPEGIHLAAMAGTVDIIMRHYIGIDTTEDPIAFRPELPDALEALALRLRWRGRWLAIRVEGRRLELLLEPDGGPPLPVRVRDRTVRLHPGTPRTFRTSARPTQERQQEDRPRMNATERG